jgi:GntR family transcriptional repressor for pyruvate dehydrogenase complex
MAAIKFPRIKASRLSEIIETSIKDLILSGELKIGSKMPTESEISRQFGVSIVTVREALRSLETLGIIERRRGKKGGTYVTSATVDVAKNVIHNFLASNEISQEHIHTVRHIIEPVAVTMAVKNITKDELKVLEDNVSYCQKRIDKKNGKFSSSDFFNIEDRHTEFHRLIAEATHNPLLFLIIDYTLDFLTSFEKDILVPDIEYSTITLKNHQDIFEDLKTGNAQAAKQHMLNDIKLVGEHHAKLVADHLASKNNRRKNSRSLNIKNKLMM